MVASPNRCDLAGDSRPILQQPSGGFDPSAMNRRLQSQQTIGMRTSAAGRALVMASSRFAPVLQFSFLRQASSGHRHL
ncbi:MAG: hypothetical protein IPL99_08685 [Candidatus Competibacteraceae bacterium]|nr:hypothetical protein [Candidatus Competibacteraceae bacterium]